MLSFAGLNLSSKYLFPSLFRATLVYHTEIATQKYIVKGCRFEEQNKNFFEGENAIEVKILQYKFIRGNNVA